MRNFKKKIFSIKKVIDIFRFILYRDIIVSAFFFILGHWLSEKTSYITHYCCVTRSSNRYQCQLANIEKWITFIESSFLVVIRLKHFENWTKNAETVPDEPSEPRFLIDFVMLPFIFGSFSKSFISFYFSR